MINLASFLGPKHLERRTSNFCTCLRSYNSLPERQYDRNLEHLQLFQPITKYLTSWKFRALFSEYRISANSFRFWIWPYVLLPLVTVHKSAETIQGRKLFKDENYSQKYGIWNSCGRSKFPSNCLSGRQMYESRNMHKLEDLGNARDHLCMYCVSILRVGVKKW